MASGKKFVQLLLLAYHMGAAALACFLTFIEIFATLGVTGNFQLDASTLLLISLALLTIAALRSYVSYFRSKGGGAWVILWDILAAGLFIVLWIMG